MSIAEMKRRLKKIDKHYSIYELDGEYMFAYDGSKFLKLTKYKGYGWSIQFSTEQVFFGVYGLRIIRDVLPLIAEFEEDELMGYMK